MIKTFRYSGNNNAVAAAGGNGIMGWLRVNTPQRKFKLLSVDFVFNSFNNVTGEQDNPYNSVTNYFNAELDNTGISSYPIYDAFNSMAPGTRITSPTLFFNQPRKYEFENLEFENEVWITVFTYNYDPVNLHTHFLQVLVTIDELPLN